MRTCRQLFDGQLCRAKLVKGVCVSGLACQHNCSFDCLHKFSGRRSSKFTYSPLRIFWASLVGTDGRATDCDVDRLVSRSRPKGGPGRSLRPGGRTELALALWSAEDEVVAGVVERRRIPSRTVKEFRAARSSKSG